MAVDEERRGNAGDNDEALRPRGNALRHGHEPGPRRRPGARRALIPHRQSRNTVYGWFIIVMVPGTVQKIRARHCCCSVRIFVTATISTMGIASLCHCGQFLCRQFWPERFKVVESGCEYIVVTIHGAACAMTPLPERECRRANLALSFPSNTSLRIMGCWLGGAFAAFIRSGVACSVAQWVCVIENNQRASKCAASCTDFHLYNLCADGTGKTRRK